MAMARQLVNVALQEIGVKESPRNSNNVKYNTWYYGRVVSGKDYPWCMAFVQWIFHQVGADKLLPIKTASCSALRDAAKKAKLWVTSGYQPGDVLIFNFHGKKTPEHTGICVNASGNVLLSVEGNTAIGDNSNGGEVMRRIRYSSQVVGAIRPLYDKDKPIVLIAQEVLDGRWNNGPLRHQKLEEAGYSYEEVQRVVNLLHAGKYKVRITASALHVRSGPDVKSKKRKSLLRGETTIILEVREGPGATAWARNADGWFSTDYIVEEKGGTL